MVKPMKRRIFSLLIIWIIFHICYLYYRNSANVLVQPTHIKDNHIIQNGIENNSKPTKYIFKGQKIGLFKAEIDRNYSATPCQSPPFLLLVINSHANHKIRRDGIRKTWGVGVSQKESDALPEILWKTVFIVGVVDDNKVMTQLYEEAKLFKDLVISNIHENRRHLTDKTILGMIWAQSFCRPTFFFKGDDDIWVNQFGLYKYVMYANRSIGMDTFWKGYVAVDNRKPIRNKHSKYYLSIQDFEGNLFPPFCSGFAYIMSGHALKAMTQVIKDVKFLPLVDDVYVGLLANKSGIKPKLELRFHLGPMHKDFKQEVQSALAKHRILTIGQQIKMRNISYRHHLDKVCSNEPNNPDSNYLDDFQLFFLYNFNQEFNCSDANSIA